MRPRIIFITGTDTGVGKTIVTSLLLSHLRQNGFPALALKPFCSGGRADAKLLYDLQDGELTLDQINPFHFSEPLAPLVAARLHRRKIPLRSVVSHIENALAKLRYSTSHPTNPLIHQSVNPFLLIEGAGGLLAPLGEGFNLLDLIQSVMRGKNSRSRSNHPTVSVIVVAPNRLGTINHTQLTVEKLRDAGVRRLTVTLMDLHPTPHATPDMRHNRLLLSEVLRPVPVIPVPYLGKSPDNPRVIRCPARKLTKTLRRILA